MNTYKETSYNSKCPFNNNIVISSSICITCNNYIDHKLDLDEHGRIYSILINCLKINENKIDLPKPY